MRLDAEGARTRARKEHQIGKERVYQHEETLLH